MAYNTAIKLHRPFSATDLQTTYNNFARLKAVRYTNIRFNEVPDTTLLDCNIQVSTNKPHSISFQPEGTNTAGDLGAAASLTYENRNIFRGSELLSIELRGAFEAITGLEGYQNQDYVEYNAEAKLQFPRFVAPFLSRTFRRRSKATSELSVAWNMQNRPEFLSYQNQLDQNDLNIKIAKAGKLPTISANAGVSTSTTSMNNNGWTNQIKTNFNVGGGIGVSIPLFDNRSTKTAVNKAMIQKQNYLLDLQDKQTTLYSTIENYWLQAVTNQNKFKAARVSTESAQASYELLSEQFKQGLKNTVELMTGKTNLLQAQQNELQSKYLAILNLNMLEFYQTGNIK